MRIISGSCRGKRLASFTGKEIRPTPDRAREALFSALFSRFGGFASLRVLDLYAGTGAMALEALSRGAKCAILVDQGQQSATIIPQNIEACKFQGKTRFIAGDVAKNLPDLTNDGPFDLVFLDPPYGKGLVPKTLESLSELNLIAPDGLVCAEAAKEDAVPDCIGTLERVELRRYGLATLHLFTLHD